MAQAIIQPSRMRRAFNGWCKGLFAGQYFETVLNLGCGHNVDRQGGTYDGYWMAYKTLHIDKCEETTYPPYEEMLCGGQRFGNPLDWVMDAEDLKLGDLKFDMVFCNWMIYHCDVERVLDQICTVLVPRGKLFVSWMGKTHDLTIYNMVEARFHPIALTTLECDQDLDGRVGSATAFWGEKR